METIAHWTEVVVDAENLVRAFHFDYNPLKGERVARERLIRFESRCEAGPEAFWAAMAELDGRAEAARLRAIRVAS